MAFAIICHCKKAYQITILLKWQGYKRWLSYLQCQGNINTTDTINSGQAIGCSLTKSPNKEYTLHVKIIGPNTKNYGQYWRLKNLGKKKAKMPYFIKTVKDQLFWGVNGLFAMPKGVN